ncbi:MAG: hypothetical protein D6711_03325 [Chloroflexi bacterium]|nr:MAG: hypothetical protein D6711_03325 [Chloroflexota bacterium]
MGKSKKDILTDPILRKGHPHKYVDTTAFMRCGACKGYGLIGGKWTDRPDKREVCPLCDGEGIIYKK